MFSATAQEEPVQPRSYAVRKPVWSGRKVPAGSATERPAAQ